MLPLAASQGEGGRRQPPPPFTGPRQERGAWACPRRPPRPLTTPPLYPPSYRTTPPGCRSWRSGKRAKWGGEKGSGGQIWRRWIRTWGNLHIDGGFAHPEICLEEAGSQDVTLFPPDSKLP